MQKVAPCLWFDDQAEEAAKLYVATFKKAKLGPHHLLWRGRCAGFWKAEGFRHDRRL
jgi:predicted 3-demethylubiquinone-9 3-methyltransferase (glyoxalase superfamily)